MSTYEANRYAFPASAIASGTLADARIPDLATSKITSGTFADARLSSSSVTQHVDLSNLNASNLTSGSVPNARIPSGAVTQHVSAITEANGTWTISPSVGGLTVQSSRYIRMGKLVSLTAWGRGANPEIYPSNWNTNRFYFTGAPITSMNTGTASDCVGIGMFLHRGGLVHAVILSNPTQIRVVRPQSGMYAADSNTTNSNTEGGMQNALFNINNSNANDTLHPSDAKAHWAIRLDYYTD